MPVFCPNDVYREYDPKLLSLCMVAPPAGRTASGRAARTSRAEAPAGVFAGAGALKVRWNYLIIKEILNTLA